MTEHHSWTYEHHRLHEAEMDIRAEMVEGRSRGRLWGFPRIMEYTLKTR